MKLRKSILGFSMILLGLLNSPALRAQNFPIQGVTNINDMSDDQIRQLMKQAAASGYTDKQIEDAARAKGATDEDIQKLRARISSLTSNQSQNGTDNTTTRLSAPKEETPDYEKPLAGVDKRLFGATLFHNKNLAFEPNLNLPTPKNYQLGPQDELIVDLWGYSEQTYKLKVSPEGFVKIPQIGPVHVNGLTIEVATDAIFKKLSSVYSGLKGDNPNTFLQVSLGNIRSIKITLLGEVVRPGTYTLPSLATVFNALYASGGPTINGSFRNIEVIRNNKTAVKLDVYDFLLNGDQTNNIRLQDQDVIKVNTYNIRVDIAGEVKRPGLYELKENESLKNAIDYAGGYTDSAYLSRVKVFRNNDKEKTISDVATSEFNSFKPQRGDKFFIEKIINRFANRVQIVGAVFRPGYFALDSTKTALTLINKADGLREDAFTGRAIINRKKEDNSLQTINFSVEDLLKGKITDIPLQREDVVRVFSKLELEENKTISIEGYVLSGGSFSYSDGMRLGDLVLLAGGLKDAASSLRIEIARRVKNADYKAVNSECAKIITVDIGNSLKPGTSGNDFILEPFDQVYVRKIPGYGAQEKVTIEGEVVYPGDFVISTRHDRISDVIKRAGGISVFGYPKGAYLLRKPAAEEALLKKTSLKRLQRNAKSKENLDSLDNLLDNEIQSSKKIGIQLEKILHNPGSKYDLFLTNGDIIKVPTILQTIEVSGEVLLPNVVRYESGKRLKSYVANSGGFSTYAQKRSAYVLYSNGSVSSTKRFLFFKFYPKIEPGSHIFIPTKPKKREMNAQESISLASAIASMALITITITNILRGK